MKFTEFAESLVELCFDAMSAKPEKRLPKYEHFYHMFDDFFMLDETVAK